jgi:Holliday junction resolvase RusA-like endonuclease
MIEKIIFPDFPMPPTINKSYKSITRRIRVGKNIVLRSSMIHSELLNKFYVDVKMWENKNKLPIEVASDLIKSWVLSGYELKVDYYFLFPREKIYTKTKNAKSKLHKLDADNRIKAGRDGLSECLKIDDTYFVSGNIEKVIQQEGKTECVIIVISKTKIQSADQLKKNLAAL